jgi:hypothetical protein
VSSTLISLAIFIAGDVLIGGIDLPATEPQPSVMLIILMAALLTFRTPSLAPLWLVGTAAAIPLSLVIGPLLGVEPRIPPTHPWSTALALIPAALGTAFGFGIRALSAGGNR